MSIFAVWAGGETALAFVDSLGVEVEGRRTTSHQSKMVPLVPANTLVIHRGGSLHFGHVFLRLLSSDKPHGSFDELVDLLPGVLAGLPDAFPEPLYPGCEADLELVLVGWSDRLERMAFSISRYSFGSTPTVGDPVCDSGAIVPIDAADLERAQELPFQAGSGDLVESLKALAIDMIAYGRRTESRNEMGFGGNMVLAQVTRNRITVTDCGPIESSC